MKIYKLHQESYQMRTYKYNGKDHLIVPVVMMREGVHSGSHGPLLHTTNELVKSIAAWNGQPVVVNHPQNEQGVYVSANLPKVREKEEVGIVFNSRMDGDKLKAELWLDVNKMATQAVQALNAIQALKPMDVSVGIYSDEEEVNGEWNGENYQAVAANYRPDHLAILPGESGACSWTDGCGIRTNKKSDNEMNKKNEKEPIRKVENNLTANSASLLFDEIREKLRDKIRPLNERNGDRVITFHFLMSVYPDYMIYEKENEDEGNTSYFKQAYAIDANNEVSLVGDPVEVKREVIYTPVQQISTNKKNGGNKMTPCCREKVNSLITNSATPWTEKNREWLEGQEEPIVDNLVNQMERKVTNEEVVQVLTSGVKTAADVLEWLPKGSAARNEIEQGLKLHEAARKEKVDHILNNTAEGVWTEDQLKEMSTDVIVNIAKSIPDVQNKVDYSARGINQQNPQVNQEAKKEVLLPAGVKRK